MDFIIDSNTTSSNNNIINGISDNIVYNSFLISNINITSNYASNISNVLKTNIDNNLANNSNFTSGTGFNTSNYASNISNILLNLINTNSGSSNYSLNISNILKTNIDANNTTTNTAIGNTSNYASNISNILLNLINTNSGSSNYSLNISNILKTNIDANNTTTNTAIGNTSNYASNISNVLLTNINTNYLQKTGGNITGNTNINGIVNINNGAGYAITYGYMQSGSLTIGGTNVNYGGNFYTGGNWNGTNTAGLLMECANNTEIAIHDNATRLASLMYYEGADNKITLGRNMGWGAISTIVINGNTGIGTINPSSKLHIEHSSTSLNTSNGGLYVYNPNNTATSSSVIGTRIGGTSANKASISLDVLNNYGWSIYITGNDTVDKCLRFNSSCDTTGLDRLKIRGSDGYTNINGGCRILNDLTVDGTINTPSILINNLNISNSIINNNTYTSNISNVLQTNINTINNNLSTNYYNQTQTNTLITNTSNYSFNISNILLNVINTNSGTGSSNYASNISNVLQGNINTTNNNLATNYLQLAGGTMTGPITTNSTTGGSLIILKTSSTVATTSILLQNNLSIYGNIGLGCSAYNNNYASNLFIETTYDILINSGNYSTIPKMIFKSSGNIGIGTTDPGTNILQIGGGGRLRIGSGDSDYTLIGTTNNDDGIFNYSATTTKIFLAGNNCTASGIGCIKYYATTNQGCHIFYAGNAERFKIDNGGNLYNNGSLINFSSYATNTTLTTNYYNKTDIDTNITNNSNYATNISNVLQGNINTTNTNISTNYFPKAGGTMTGTLNISSLNTKLSFGSRTQDNLIDLYNGVYGIGVNDYVMRYNAWDLASHKFYSGTTNTASISSNGILTIAAVNIGSVSINNWLFNSSGFNHETISDFNNITGFGYRFINGIGSAPTNGPATGDTQYYSWYIGLGAEYPAISGSSSYGMQFAIGRHDVNPKLCIRRKQDNSWTSWQGLTAEKAVSLTSGDKTISGICSATTFSGSGASLSNIPFTALTGTSPYLLKTTDTISGTLSFSSAGQNFLIYLYGTSYGFGINADTLRYNAGVNGTHKFYTESTLTASISKTGLITATEGFSGNGSLLTNLAYANITGKPTNFQADWLTTIINKPSTFAADMTNIYSKNETSNLITSTSNALQTNINTKEAILTFSNPLTRNTNTISINLSSYSTTGNDTNYLLKTGGTMTGSLNMTTGCLKITGNVSNPGDNSSASFWNQASVGATISAFQITFQTNGITERMRIDSTGNVNIGTSGQLYKLYVNGTTYLNDNTTINGSLSATGLITTSGNIDCGGGIAINGANAFFNIDAVNAGNLTNTYISFKDIGASSDWCYIRQIGGNNAFKLAFDFHDDGTDARFCIRNVKSTDATDTITEVFTVDNGNTTMTGICTANGGFSGSGASLTSIPFSALTGTSPYVLKAGDIMSGDLTISKAAARLSLKGTGAGAVTRLDLSAYDHTTFEPTCSFIITDDTQYSSSLNIKIKTPGSNANSQFSALFIKSDGNIGIGNDNPTYKLDVNGSLNASTINRAGVEIDSRYLKLSGGTMTGQLQLTTATGNNSLFIYSSATNAINNIELKNNLLKSCYIGIGGGGYSGNYIDTLFIQSPTALILNTNGNGSSSTPNFIIKNNGNIGIGNLSADAGKLCIGSSVYSTDGASDGTLVISKTNAVGSNRSFKFGYDANYNFCMGDNLGNGTYTWRSNDLTINYSTGNIGIGVVPHATYKLDVNGSLNASTINRAGVEIDSRYLQLSGGSITGDLTLNKINPAIQLGGTNGNNWAVAGANAYYSQSALAGDMVLRSLQKLHLQTGGAKSAMTISTNNNIGIGTDTEYSTATKLIIKGTSSGASQPIVRIEQLGTWIGSANNYAFQVSGYSDLGGIRINGTDTINTIYTTGNNDMGISTNAGVIKFLTNATEKMRIDSNGNVGIGITPNCLLHLHKPGNNQESRIRFTDTTTGTSASDGVSILKTDQHDLFLMVHESARMLFFTSDLVRMNILANGYVNIGSQNPNNIFQVGDGARLRISNGISDYTLIGTKDVDNATNTRIVIGGNTRDNFTNKGTIEYIATSSTGHHLFYSSDNTNYTERMRILSDGKIGIGTATPNRNFEVYGTNPALVIRAADENQTSTLFLGTGHINIGAYKCAIIAAGYTGWSRSKLHFCLNNNGASNEYPTYNATIADAKMTILPSGNVGIGTVTPLSILHIEHSSTTFNAEYGGLYLYNPNTSSTSCSCLGARINGSTANKAGLSLDVSGYYGWSMYINGNDTTDRQLRFNSTWDGTGTEILQIRGSDGYATFSGNMQIGSKTSQKGTGPASLLIGDSTGTSSLILTNVANAVWKIDTLNLCLNFYNDTTTSGTFVNKMQITKAGNLLVSGDISAFANMSDKRLKHNITNLSINCIDLLNNIKPVEFIWNDMDEIINIKRNTYDHGFIAQDIEILLPNIVNQYDKYKSIKYEKLTPYLVKGFQELYKLIQVLQEDNIRQQQQIIDLQNQINMIKSQLS